MGKILLTNGQYAIVDDDMVDFLNQWTWWWEQGYARRFRSVTEDHPYSRIHMSHVVIGITLEQRKNRMVVDHINFNRLDNRRCNLRIIPHWINSKHSSEETKAKRRARCLELTKIAATRPRTERQAFAVRQNAKAMNAAGKNRHVGANNYISKKVVCLESGIIFDCVREAAEAKNINYRTLKSKLNGWSKNNTTLRHV